MNRIHFITPGKPLFKLAALLAFWSMTLTAPSPLHAQTPAYDSSGPVNIFLGNPTLAEPFFQLSDPSTQVPYYLLLKQDPSSPSSQIDLEVQMAGLLQVSGISSPPMNGSLLEWNSETGSILVTEVGVFGISWTANSVPGSIDQLGIGALSVNGLPSQQNNQGENVTVDLYSGYAISATLAQPYLPSFTGTTTTLSPQGLRTAQFNGIIATSYGLQDNNANNTAQGGNVQVTTQAGSTINVASDDPNVLTAGISAASASGGGKADGIGTNQSVTVNHGGSIVNTSPQGIGIMAVSTGALFPASGDSVAVGGPVTVNLTGTASISVTGTTSIGVFAVSEAYTTSDPPKNSTVAGGTVSGTIGAGTTITTGGANSNLSIGYLAVSTGTDGLLNPFTSQSVNKTGSGSGGQVNLTNFGLVSTTGTMSIGLAALSTGGAGIVTNTDSNGSGYSYVGNSGTVSDGSGDQVTVTNSGTIITVGNSAIGIVAISSGGGGIINNDLAGSSSGGVIIGDNNTSNSDPASNGGAVGVTNNGSIQTGTGDDSSAASIGIVAQSIGGSGGTAGGGQAALFAGDKGGGGGTGGTVTVTTGTFSTISTQDTNSVGILAQSIGGGGGNGANAKGLFVAVGGRGGNGGDGGIVTLDLSGNITTTADHAAGAIGQSIGGGGGNGGGAKSIGFFFDTGIGGKGGHGGIGELTEGTLEATGTISTTGNNSAGMVLQSVGGGGGTGGAAYSGNAGLLATVTIAVGGGGGNGGAGGIVSATNQGTISTGIPIPTGSFTGLPTINGDDSAGIIAQSVGGGGGHAGSAVAKSLNIQAPDVPGTLTFNLTLGGTGGAAGDGSAVSVYNESSVATYGDGSHAIIAQSVGGGGGDGGDSTAASLMLGTSAAEVDTGIALGGQGGAAGNGAGVLVYNIGGSDPTTASIVTQGQNAAGILAQSIGGGGGNGGFGTSKSHVLAVGSDSSSYVFTLDMGGKGGNGGTGGFLTIANAGSIITQGSGSQGILAQSIGGGGGNSGGGSSSASNNTITLTLDIGANGAHGGNAAQPESTIQNSGIIQTSGGDASGIVAQAIGGGGGNGGSSDNDATIGNLGQALGQLSSNFTYTSQIVVGGKGGVGGLGGWLDVLNQAGANETTATINTAGTRAYGMVAQSIGGGGGIGGAATADANAIYLSPLNRNVAFNTSLALGGAGGAGSNGGTVDGLNSGVITTSGFSSHGVVLQSVGGGGGIAADGSLDVRANLSLGVQIGEAAGSASSGGTITFMQNGKIQTSAADAMGIFAQSVGGGGGLGTVGSFFTFPVKGGSVASIGVNAALGFHLSNSTPSDGGTVTITNGPNTGSGYDPNGGVIVTTGDWSHGIVGQSIGGGGGKASTIYGTSTYYYPDLAVQVGGSEGKGNGGTVSGTLTGGSITTGTTLSGTSASGYSAFGYVAQSIGGGGGLFSDASSTSTGSITLGGTTGVSGNGGATSLTTLGNTAAITTNGYGAHGVILQSIGGGGGIAGTGNSSITASTSGAAVVVGGNDASGNGGNVDVSNSVLKVTTTGDNAYALIAQSIGGGGGIATALNSTAPGNSAATGNPSRLGAIGATTDSNGGDVNLSLGNGSQITTSGFASHGLVIQSIGGGGGIANPDIYSGVGGLTTTLGTANNSKALGYGGNVNVNVDANITTTGNGAYGVIVQSVGGGGGIFGNYAGSTGSASSSGTGTSNGTITLTQNGAVTASGQNSVGIFAQNTTANHSGNSVTLNINGSVSGTGAGVWVADGRNNNINISTTGTVSSAVGNALLYTGSQATTVTNFGTVNGSIDLGNSTNTLNNKGTFNSGTTVNGQILNEVLVNPGGAGAATHSTITGDLDSVTGSILQFDIYSPTQNDQILFSSLTFGASLAFSTKIVANFNNNVVLGAYDYLLIGAGNNSYVSQAELNTNLQMLNFNPAAGDTFSYGLYINGTDNSLHLSVDVVPEPNSAWLLLLGGLGLGLAHGYRRMKSAPRPSKSQ